MPAAVRETDLAAIQQHAIFTAGDGREGDAAGRRKVAVGFRLAENGVNLQV